jgi:hypothetical protein
MVAPVVAEAVGISVVGVVAEPAASPAEEAEEEAQATLLAVAPPQAQVSTPEEIRTRTMQAPPEPGATTMRKAATLVASSSFGDRDVKQAQALKIWTDMMAVCMVRAAMSTAICRGT